MIPCLVVDTYGHFEKNVLPPSSGKVIGFKIARGEMHGPLIL
jgi:hypothetical protein